MKPLNGPKDPIVRSVRGVYDWLDTFMGRALVQFPSSCREGCAHCCQMQVLVHNAEAHVLAWHLQHGRLPGAADVVVELRRQDAEIERLAARVNQGNAIEHMVQMGKVYWEAGIACAFLDPVNRLCRIYRDRPSQCRMHHVANSSERCSREVGDADIEKLHIGRAGDDSFQLSVLGRLAHVSERSGMPSVVGALPGMVLEALGFESASLGVQLVETL